MNNRRHFGVVHALRSLERVDIHREDRFNQCTVSVPINNKNNIKRCLALARKGLYGKVIRVLDSAGIATLGT